MIELLASELTEEHLDQVASVSWRGLWCIPVRLKTFESVTRANGELIQRTLIFHNGTSYTADPNIMKVRIWP